MNFQEKYDDAESKGEASLKAAQQVDDKQWQLNALVLIAQAQGELISHPYTSFTNPFSEKWKFGQR